MRDPNDPLGFLNDLQPPPRPPGGGLTQCAASAKPPRRDARAAVNKLAGKYVMIAVLTTGISVTAVVVFVSTCTSHPHFDSVAQLLAWLNAHGIEANDTGMAVDNTGLLPERIVRCKGYEAAIKEAADLAKDNPLAGMMAVGYVSNWQKTLRIAWLPNSEMASNYAKYQFNKVGGQSSGIDCTAYDNFAIMGDKTCVHEVAAALGVKSLDAE